MKKIPTAEEYIKSFPYFEAMCCNSAQEFIAVSEHMIEFAKLHVEAALKAASENFKMKIKDNVHELDMNDDWIEVDKNSILTAYSLENIK